MKSNLLLIGIVFPLFARTALSQEIRCDPDSEIHFCGTGQLCLQGICETAVVCSEDSNCTIPGHECIARFCEPELCSATGQCMGNHVCSGDTTRRCVERRITDRVEEEPGFIGLPVWRSHTVLTWYKGSRDSKLIERTPNGTTFYGDFCVGASECDSTTRGDLSSNGDLVIFSLVPGDTASYYYNLAPTGGREDPGWDYELQIDVSGLFRCGANLTGDSGNVTTPNYPAEYPDLSACEWTITVEPYRIVSLEIQDFNLEECCSCDYIEIRDGVDSTAPLVATLCDSLTVPSAVNTKTNMAHISFRSDRQGTASGFRFLWKQEVTVCNADSESNQCIEGAICTSDICEEALTCADDTACPAAGEACIGGYCQADPCTSSGQCAGGRVCSTDTTRRCVQVTSATAVEGGPASLVPPEFTPSTPVSWYRASRANLLAQADVNGDVKYHGPWCEGASPCDSSTQGSLDPVTGGLTIFTVSLADELYYYYDSTPSGGENSGRDRAVLLVVYVVPDENTLSIRGLEGPIQEGATVEITCHVPRVKPVAELVALSTFGVVWNSDVITKENPDGETFSQETGRNFTMRSWNNGMEVKCLVRHVNGEERSTAAIVKISECDETSSFPVCGRGEICADSLCQEGAGCGNDTDCAAGTEVCSTAFCHPAECATNAQCVTGRICSSDTVGRCVYPFYQKGMNTYPATLSPPVGTPFIDITWYKGSRATPIVYYNKTEDKLEFYGEFCAVSDTCSESTKGEFNKTSGGFSIFKASRSDAGNYYFDFTPVSGKNFGQDYQVILRVIAEIEIGITGLPNIVENGTSVELTCRVDRVEPPLRPVVWGYNGRNFTSGVIFWINPDQTYTIVTITPLTLYDGDNGKDVTCFTVFLYGYLEARTTVNIGEVTTTMATTTDNGSSGGESLGSEIRLKTICLAMILYLLQKENRF